MGGIIGGIGSAMGGKKASEAAETQAAAQLEAARIAAQTARLGFDWGSTGAGSKYFTPYMQTGTDATNAIAALLGIGGDPRASEAAFKRYQDSTGYQFRLGEGMDAVTGSAAARGMLNSGATLKGLTSYGQNLASGEFGNYLSQLFNVGTRGLDASKAIMGAGTAGGIAGSTALMQGAQNASALQMHGIGAKNSGMQGLFGGIGSTMSGKQATAPASTTPTKSSILG